MTYVCSQRNIRGFQKNLKGYGSVKTFSQRTCVEIIVDLKKNPAGHGFFGPFSQRTWIC